MATTNHQTVDGRHIQNKHTTGENKDILERIKQILNKE